MTMNARPVIPMYFKLWDSLLRNLETVVVDESIRDWEGKMYVIVFKH